MLLFGVFLRLAAWQKIYETSVIQDSAETIQHHNITRWGNLEEDSIFPPFQQNDRCGDP